jgi:hypothetical protein
VSENVPVDVVSVTAPDTSLNAPPEPELLHVKFGVTRIEADPPAGICVGWKTAGSVTNDCPTGFVAWKVAVIDKVRLAWEIVTLWCRCWHRPVCRRDRRGPTSPPGT